MYKGFIQVKIIYAYSQKKVCIRQKTLLNILTYIFLGFLTLLCITIFSDKRQAFFLRLENDKDSVVTQNLITSPSIRGESQTVKKHFQISLILSAVVIR